MESNVPNIQADLLRLRKRLMDLQTIGVLEESQHGLYQQTILQLWQEADRQRQTCMDQAETLRRQAAAAEAQAHAFSTMSSMMYAVVNGYVLLEEKRVREERERASERVEDEKEPAQEGTKEASAPSASFSEEAKPNGRRKKT